jgi:hypothetical protein
MKESWDLQKIISGNTSHISPQTFKIVAYMKIVGKQKPETAGVYFKTLPRTLFTHGNNTE